MRKLWLIIILVARTASAGNNCTCANLKEIEYRMKEIETAIATYKAEIARLGQSPPFSNNAFHQFEIGALQLALDNLKAANPGSPQTGAASTDPMSCNVRDLPKVSACLLDALRVHEGHHASVCKTINGSYGELTHAASDYRRNMTLAEAYQGEIDSYLLELDALSKALRDLPDTCKPKDWYLKWTVTVTGKSNPGVKLAWHVRHEYSGTVQLVDQGTTVPTPTMRYTAQQLKAMTKAQMMALAQSMTSKKLHLWMSKAPPMSVPVDVVIDDKTKRKNHSPGEGSAYEDTTTSTTWKTKGTIRDEVSNSIRLEVDEQAKTYNITIPLALMGTAKTVDVEDTVEVDRTPFGYASTKTHEGPTTTPASPPSVTAATMKNPEVASLIANGNVHHDKDRSFAPKEDVLQFDSGAVNMDATSTFLQNLPGALDKIKVQVVYTLSKRPIN